MTSWSQDARNVPKGPIVYRARLVTDNGGEKPISRFFGDDPEGILLIGESTTGYARFQELWGALRGDRVGRGHGPGFTFYHWFKRGDVKPENVRLEWFDLRENLDRFDKADAKRVAQAAEVLLLGRYRISFGDLPPCNTQGPKWWAVTTWMSEKWQIPWGYVEGPTSRWNVPMIAVPGVPAISIEEARRVGQAAKVARP